MSPPIPTDRFLGCLLGQAVGDALGAPFEGLPADFIFWTYGPIHEPLDQGTAETLRYTDDTQMMVGVAETLIAHGEVRQDALGRHFAANCEPDRGYGTGAGRILECIAEGGDWEQLAQTVFPGGSFGNGAAMRAAPVGLLSAVKAACPVPVAGVVSDGRRSIRRAVGDVFPGVPYQLCQFPCLREAARPIYEADRRAK